MTEKESETKKWFERYNLIGVIGSGGMGQVFLAEDLHNGNQKVVVKQTKLDENSDHGQLVKIFFREADLLRRLNHRSIVKLTDEFWSRQEPEYMFLVMEYVPGDNLEKIVSTEGPLSSETVIKIAIQCCDVLEYLHGQQPPIIYRDLKPSNLILRPDGLVVFVDFGIARDFEPKGPSTRVVTSGYAPPEQYFGKPEPRGDIYSLGATMHQLLTAVRPRPLTQCSPATILPTVMKELDTLIRQMTEHEIDLRPPSARVVQFELFRLYKMLHPDFEIPNLGMDEDDEDEEEDYGSIAASPKGRLSSAAEPPKSLRGKVSSGSFVRSNSDVLDANETKTSLLEKLKQWVYELRSRF